MKAPTPSTSLFYLLLLASTASALRGQQSTTTRETANNRRLPDNAPPNADQNAYARRRNEDDVIDGNKRIKGVDLMADGVNRVVIMPGEMVDCDSSLDPSCVINESDVKQTETDVSSFQEDEELHDELYYVRELMTLTKGADYTTRFFEEERRLAYDTGIATSEIGTFKPLKCNFNADNSSKLASGQECDVNPDGWMSVLVDEAGSEAVVIPCGKCIKVRVCWFNKNDHILCSISSTCISTSQPIAKSNNSTTCPQTQPPSFTVSTFKANSTSLPTINLLSIHPTSSFKEFCKCLTPTPSRQNTNQ